ncbi:MAG: hypothetical protein LBM06_00695 [Prevotellaceae bacterium]|jgi:hypothetical protein|nr:hypothetical protein [Prevotellaceae bacterium]
MKKTLLWAVMLLLTAASAQAQLYGGSSFEITSSNTTLKDAELYSAGNHSDIYTLSPELFYRFNDKWELGLTLSFSSVSKSVTSYAGGYTIREKSKYRSYAITPFTRYTLLSWNKFRVKLQGSAGVTLQRQGDQEDKYTLYGFNITPLLTYDLSNRFMLLANLQFFGLSYQYITSEEYKGQNFRFIYNKNIAKIGDLAVGFAYRF